MDEDDKYDVLIKLLILGNSTVGKSNYIHRFIEEEFNPVHVSTVGFDFKTKICEVPNLNKRIKFQIWDTAGQEKYMSINKTLFQKVQGIILMYDITNKESFNNLDIWMEAIKENSNESPVILIGNKIDLESERVVTKTKGENYAKQNNIHFFESSGKSGENVSESFFFLVELIINEESFIKNKPKNAQVVNKKTATVKKKHKCC